MRAPSNCLIGLLRVILVLVCLALTTTEVRAQSTTQQLEAIRTLMEEGLGLFTGGKPKEAAKLFEAGYAKHPYSAFLFNAGVCWEKAGDNQKALAKYKEYLAVDPKAPDIDDVKARIARLEGTPSPEATPGPDGQVPPPPSESEKPETLRSLVVVETEPVGAPVRVFRPNSKAAPSFQKGGANPDWTEIVTATSPTSLSLRVGRYYILVDKFKDFNASGTELSVSPGHVHHFKANLSQGVFMAFLRVSANANGAHIYLDDPNKLKPEWGTTPYGELVAVGEHDLLVELPGFESLRTKVALQSGERKEIELRLSRVDYGRVKVSANVDDAQILLDGKVRGRWRKGYDPVMVEAPSGRHELSVISEDRKDYVGEVIIPKGQVVPVEVNMIPKYPRGTAWAQAIIAAASVSAGVYAGLESERLKKDLKEDRARNVLASDDVRLQLGFWYAVGADVGFAAGAVLGGLATWNFIKDPLPESSAKAGEFEEFFDPLKKRPTAPLAVAPRGPRRFPHAKQRAAQKPSEPPATSDWRVGPALSPNTAGLSFGAQF